MQGNIATTKKMLVYAEDHVGCAKGTIVVPPVSTLTSVWGNGKRTLAWRVSGHMRLHGKKVTHSAEKTLSLLAELFPNALPALHIIHPKYVWNGPPVKRNGKPPGIVWHHEDANDGNPNDGLSDVQEVHAYHKSLGWRGIAYHLVVAFNGDVFEGRPLDTIGAHTFAHGDWIGVAAEGNYEKTGAIMPPAQFRAMKAVHAYLHSKYGGIPDRKHKDMPQNSTACPGKCFPFDKITT